jgi:hypothetical protein
VLRSLPIRVAPLPGEAVDSWLEALAFRMHSSWGDLCETVGLSHHRHTRGPLTRLAPQEVDRLACVTGTDGDVVQAMTLNSVSAAVGAGPTARGSIESLLWMDGGRSRFCPRCLAENDGRWNLHWRLRWTYACVRHRCLLADCCPGCRQTQRTRCLPLDRIPTPNQCCRKTSDGQHFQARSCGTDLTAAAALPLPHAHIALAAQDFILRGLETGYADFGIYRTAPVTPATLLADLAALGGRILAYATGDEITRHLPESVLHFPRELDATRPARRRPGVTADARSADSATAVSAAWPVLSKSTISEAGQRLRWLIGSSRQQRVAVRASTLGWGRGVSTSLIAVQLAALSPFLSPSDQLRYRTCARTPAMPWEPTPLHRAVSVPSMMWPRYSLCLRCDGIGHQQLRRALSVALLIVGSHLTLAHAVRALGSVTSPHTVSRILQHLERSADWRESAQLITDLAEYLDRHPAPIDYARRRRLSTADLLPVDVWLSVCRQIGVRPGRGIRHRLARCWVHERVTGLPARTSMWADDSPEFRTKLADFPLLLSAELSTAIHEYALDFLRVQGITDEPVQWTPEILTAAKSIPALVPPPLTVDVAELHRRILAEAPRTLAGLARSFGTDVDVLRYVLECTPVRRAGADAIDGESAFTRAARCLPRDRFEELYLTQRLGLAAIADQVGVSRQTVTALARAYGVPLRRPGHPVAHSAR